MLGSSTEVDAIDEHICDVVFALLAEDYLVVSGSVSREPVLDIAWMVNTLTGSTVDSRRMRDSYRTGMQMVRVALQ